MKINMQIICKNRNEYERAEDAVGFVMECMRDKDVIDANIFISADDFGGLKTKSSIKREGNTHAEK